MSDQIPSEAPEATMDTAVRVSRQVSHPIDDVWKVLLTDEGTEALLGPGGKLGTKGQGWQADDGTHGVTRSFHAKEQIRFSWHRDQDAPATIVDLELAPVDDNMTKLEIVHDKLPVDADREWLSDRWTKALDRIADDAL